jgi:hypothetical protein
MGGEERHYMLLTVLLIMEFNYLDYSKTINTIMKNIKLCHHLLTEFYAYSSFLSLQLLIDKAFMELQGVNTSAFRVSSVLALQVH